jgi:hypothetical protein
MLRVIYLNHIKPGLKFEMTEIQESGDVTFHCVSKRGLQIEIQQKIILNVNSIDGSDLLGPTVVRVYGKMPGSPMWCFGGQPGRGWDDFDGKLYSEVMLFISETIVKYWADYLKGEELK